MNDKKVFFINSNICMDQSDISTYESFMNSIAGNTGNSYITYSLIKELYGKLVPIHHIKNIYTYDFEHPDNEIRYINEKASHVFLILQDQIRIQESYNLKLPYQKIMKFISRLNKPVVIAGLGANSFSGFDPDFHKKLDPELVYFLKYLSDHTIKIGIRGEFTQEVLHNIGVDNTHVIGCPSFFERGPDRRMDSLLLTDISQVLLTSRLPHIKLKLDTIMQDNHDEDIILEKWHETQGSATESSSGKDISKYHIFSSIDDWKKYISRFRFALGYRLHGAIISINSGVPALCMNGDTRAKEMCDFLGIPHDHTLDPEEEEDVFEIYQKADFGEINRRYPKLYQNFIEFIHENNMRLFDEKAHKRLFSFQKEVQQPSIVQLS